MNIEQLLKDLTIKEKGTYSKDGSYVIDLESSKAFGVIYSKLENSDDLEQKENSTLLTIHNGSIVYKYKDEYQLILIADWDNDSYKLVIEEI